MSYYFNQLFKGSNRFMVLLYEDGFLCFYDFGKGRPEGSLTGHSEKVIIIQNNFSNPPLGQANRMG